MIPVYAVCQVCRGACRVGVAMQRCSACDGLGRQWEPGAPAYGCTVTLADREPGEIVTLGNGQRAKILWHMPRKRPKVKPETTFLDLLVEFHETETYIPVAYPSCIGVASVDSARTVTDRDAHDRERVEDQNDPMQRREGALL